MAAYEILLLNTAIPQIQAAQSGDTYVVPRDIAFSTVASFAAGAEATPSIVATGDTNTGIWFPAADTVAISTGGISRLRLDSSGNLLIGYTSNNLQSGTFGQTIYGSIPGLTFAGTEANARIYTLYETGGSFKLFDRNAGADRWTVDSSGNLGLGVTPSAWASGQPALQIGSGTAINNRSAVLSQFSSNQRWDGSNHRYLTNGTATLYTQNDGAHSWATAASGTAGNAISFTQAMTLDASGNLLVGTTNSSLGATDGVVIAPLESAWTVSNSGNVPIRIYNKGSSGTRYCMEFRTASTAVGSITHDGTNTAYNTSSDYRLKDNQQPLTGSGAFIDALKPKTWDWKSGGKGVGFIAHEVAEVSPGTVVGTKDAVDEEGKPIMQAMEYGSAEFIANIIAELQSLRARVAQLEQGA